MYIFSIISIVSLFEFVCWGNVKYILLPKDNAFGSFQEGNTIAVEHNLEEVATFDFQDFKLPVYKTDHNNMKKYKHTLSKYFEIEEDATIQIDYKQHNTFDETAWHLPRVSNKAPSNGKYMYSDKGSCHTNDDLIIDTYIIDTGIDVEHPQFEGRAVWGENFIDKVQTDCNNHGTHVAGLVGSKDYGVCVDANLIAVKVLDCKGSGSLSGVIKGIEYAFNKHTVKSNKNNNVKSVINMSLGGGFSRILNKAVEKCVESNANFFVVVAAGNENNDACKSSPASVRSILTVMASDKSDNRGWFSNWGACADIYAPGVSILSTIPGGKTAVYSGTSMASPVMAGVLNHYIDMYPKETFQSLKEKIKEMSNKDVITGDKPNTVNDLVYFHRENSGFRIQYDILYL